VGLRLTLCCMIRPEWKRIFLKSSRHLLRRKLLMPSAMRIFLMPFMPSRPYFLLLLRKPFLHPVWTTCLCIWLLVVHDYTWLVYAFMLCLCLFPLLHVCTWLGWPISLPYHALDCIAVISHITALVVLASTLILYFRPVHHFQWCEKGEDEYELVCFGLPIVKLTSYTFSFTFLWLGCLALTY